MENVRYIPYRSDGADRRGHARIFKATCLHQRHRNARGRYTTTQVAPTFMCVRLKAAQTANTNRTVVEIETTLSQEWSRNSIQRPQCAFELSMFMCPAVHKLTRNLLRSSSTHEPSDPPFRVIFYKLQDAFRQRQHWISNEIREAALAAQRASTLAVHGRTIRTIAKGRSAAFHSRRQRGTGTNTRNVQAHPLICGPLSQTTPAQLVHNTSYS